ncbi:cobalamin B12-binding domain protein, partial [sediment metagenome]
MPDDLLAQLARRLYDGDAASVTELTGRCLEAGLGAAEVLDRGLMPGMDEVGRDFQAGELFIPEIIVAARAMHAGIDVLRPHLAAAQVKPRGTIVLGTVKGDLHDIGKKLVGIMMQSAGFAVVDLGHDVPKERFVQEVRTRRPELVGLSALLSTTVPMMRATLEAFEQAGIRSGVKILVGGAPVTQALADAIGADGYAADAVGPYRRRGGSRAARTAHDRQG